MPAVTGCYSRSTDEPESEGDSMECGAMNCRVEDQRLLIVVDDGKTRRMMCPNHAIFWALGVEEVAVLPSLLKEPYTCEVCGKPGGEVVDFPDRMYLCAEETKDLLLHRLRPEQWRILHRAHPGAFLLHDDYYDDDGTALQPVTER